MLLYYKKKALPPNLKKWHLRKKYVLNNRLIILKHIFIYPYVYLEGNEKTMASVIKQQSKN